MTEHEITGINKPNRMSVHEHITHIGNLEGHWRITRESAMSRISKNTEAFYTVDRTTGRKIYIGVVPSDGVKGPYLKTHADGKWE